MPLGFAVVRVFIWLGLENDDSFDSEILVPYFLYFSRELKLATNKIELNCWPRVENSFLYRTVDGRQSWFFVLSFGRKQVDSIYTVGVHNTVLGENRLIAHRRSSEWFVQGS